MNYWVEWVYVQSIGDEATSTDNFVCPFFRPYVRYDSWLAVERLLLTTALVFAIQKKPILGEEDKNNH